MHPGTTGGRAAGGQPARIRDTTEGSRRRLRRDQIDGRARRQASGGAQRPARAVVERPGLRRTRPAARNSRRLVRRGRTGLGDQFLRLAPEPRVLRSGDHAHREHDSRECRRAPGAAHGTAPRPGWVDGDARRRLRRGGPATTPPGGGPSAPSTDPAHRCSESGVQCVQCTQRRFR